MSGRTPNDDHLAELARLIGQDVPFRDPRSEGARPAPRRDAATPYVEAPQSAPGWLARQRGAGSQAVAASPAPSHDDDAHYEDAARYSPPVSQARREDEPRHIDAHYDAVSHDGIHSGGADGYAEAQYDASYDPAHADETGQYYDDAHQADAYADEVPSRRPRAVALVAAVVGLAVLGTGGVFAYRAISGPSSSSAQPPVIKAQDAPTKVVPPPATADNQPVKQIYDRVSDKGGAEKLGTTPEEPLDVKGANQRAGIPGLLGTVPPSGIAPQTAPQAGPGPAGEPKKVKTVPIRPDQATGTTAPATRAPAAAPPANAPMRVTSNQTQTPPARNAAVSGGFVVQVASQRSELDAQASFRSLQSKYPTVLGSQQAMIRKFDSGEKGVYYRAQVGPFATIDQAKEMCSSLQAAGGQCVVQKN